MFCPLIKRRAMACMWLCALISNERAIGQPTVIDVPLQVLKHPTVKGIDDHDLNAILASVQQILSDECSRIREACVIKLNRVTPKLRDAPLADPDTAVARARQLGLTGVGKERPEDVKAVEAGIRTSVRNANNTGNFKSLAVLSYLDLATSNTKPVTIHIVNRLDEGCPTASVGEAGGCTVIYGNTAVISLYNYKSGSVRAAGQKWEPEDKHVWSHEIGHVLGLHDHQLHISVVFDPAYFFLMSPRTLDKRDRLLPHEAQMIKQYRNTNIQNYRKNCTILNDSAVINGACR